MLLVATVLTLAAFGARSADLQPSAQRVLVTAVVGLLSVLFWPGVVATPARTVFRVVAWSGAAALLAAAALLVLGDSTHALAKLLSSCAMLLLILLVAHALIAALEMSLRAGSCATQGAGETASRSGALALAALGSLPLWAGPFAEMLSGRHEWAIDAAIAASPLTHLAVASGNDLLRNQWFYQHANLAGLQFAYPGLVEVIATYASACVLLALGAFAFERRRRAGASAIHPPHPTEIRP